MAKTALGLTFSRLIGFMIFLLVLIILNTFPISGLPSDIVSFLNKHLILIIIYSILFYLGDLFSIFTFPLNIPYPLFNSFGAVFLVGFIFQVIYAISGAFYIFLILEPIAILLTFILVLIVGYIKVFASLIPKGEKKVKTKKKSKNDVDWADIGKEFKMALFNLGKTLKKALDPKK